jgi:hypothetical protein
VQTKITGEIKTISSGEPVEMVTGTCSNPEPPEGLETSFRFDMVVAAIKASDTASLIDAIIRWLDAAAYLHANRAQIFERDPLTWNLGRIPALNQEQRNDTVPSDAAVAAVRAAAIYCISVDRPFPASELVAGFLPHLGEDHLAVKLLSRLGKATPFIDAGSSSTSVLSNLASGAPRSPEDSLIASIHLLELTSRMDWRRILEQPVANWIAAEWTKVANTRQFGIASPRINGPAILATVARSKSDLASGAEIVLTALPAVKTRLHPDQRHRLEDLRNAGKPIEA